MKTVVEGGKTWVDIDQLIPWEDNPRDITEDALKQLCDDLTDAKDLTGDGQLIPLVTTPAGMVIGGNQRLKAYKHLGWKKVWVNVIEAQNPKQVFKIAMRLNHIYGYTDEAEAARVAIEVGLDKTEMGKLFIVGGNVKTIGGMVDALGPGDGDDGQVDSEDLIDKDKKLTCPRCGFEMNKDKKPGGPGGETTA